ncbi:TPA: hypothetical protein ACXHW4_004583 [Enterobacter hormaechei]
MNGLGENVSDVRASSAVLSRSLSCPVLLSTTVSNEASSSTTGTKANVGLAGFGGLHKALALQDLFAAAGADKQEKLATLFLQSSNAYACREITAFAKVYSQLIHQPNLSADARATLDTLAQQYTDKIVNDGLGEKSAFGPWTAKLDKKYQQRSNLEHTLATFANTHSAGDFLQLGSGFMAREVMPFIQTCIERQLGAALNETTCQRLHELVDQAAMKTFDALRQSRVELLEQRGVGVGKLARDLDTVATLPLLLRDILGNLPKDLPQTTQPTSTPAPDTSTIPGLAANPGAGGITINIGDIHIDKSQYIDNSRHVNNRNTRERSTPTPLAQNLNLRVNKKVTGDATPDTAAGTAREKAYAGGSQSSKNQVHEAHIQTVKLLNVEVDNLSQDTSFASITAGEIRTLRPAADAQTETQTQTSTSSAGGLFDAARGVANSLSQLLDIADTRGTQRPGRITTEGAQAQHTEHTELSVPGRLNTVVSKPLTSSTDTVATPLSAASLSGVDEQRKVGSELLRVAKSDASETAKTTDASRHAKLKFREGNLYTLPTIAYLRSTGGQIKPEHELLKAVRSMLEADSNQPLEIRRDFDGLRNKLLPGFETDRTQLLQKFLNESLDETLQNDVNTLRELLAEHPGLDRRRPAVASFARTLIRECGLMKPGQHNPLIVALLDGVAGTGDNKWNWREEALLKQPKSTASGIVSTMDGLHLDQLHARKNDHAK